MPDLIGYHYIGYHLQLFVIGYHVSFYCINQMPKMIAGEKKQDPHLQKNSIYQSYVILILVMIKVGASDAIYYNNHLEEI